MSFQPKGGFLGLWTSAKQSASALGIDRAFDELPGELVCFEDISEKTLIDNPPDFIIFPVSQVRSQVGLLLERIKLSNPHIIVVMACSLEERQHVGRYTDLGIDEIIFLPSSIDEMVIRFQNQLTKLHHRRKETERETETKSLLELTQTLASSFDFHEILLTVLRKITDIIRVDRASLLLTSGVGEFGTAILVATSDDETLSDLKLDLSKYPEIQEVLRTREALTVPDASVHPLLGEIRNSGHSLRYKTLSLFPALWRDEVVGVLFLRSFSSRMSMSPREKKLCQQVTNAMAVALRNAHAMRSLRTDAASSKQALISEIAGTAAHELNQPLMSVMGSIELLQRNLDVTSAEYKASQTILTEMERMAEIVRKLGRVNRYETKEYVGTQKILDLDRSVGTDDETSPQVHRSVVHELNDRLQKKDNELFHAQRLATLGKLTAGMIHELNNPLTSISVYSNYLLHRMEEHQFSDSDLTKAKRVVQDADRMIRLARNWMQYSRPSTAVMSLVSLNDILRQSLTFSEHLMKKLRIHFEQNLESDSQYVFGMTDQLQQVFVNLVINACHAIEERKRNGDDEAGVITLRAGSLADTDMLKIEVSDNGVGISKENQRRIFEPFFSTKSKEQGTGLGLSIVRSLVRAHRGDIHVESVLGQGTTFVVLLPKADTTLQRP